MSAQSPTELETFQQFLSEHLASGDTGLSPEELVRLWRARQDEYAEAVEAVREGVADMEAGRTRPLEDAAEEIRRRHGYSHNG
ncbi:MAG: hypothetical protein O7J95_13170 [Planctomycetota bacterium]|nr:hypothetical protein [Planctomycetota bacterium]